jgi:hypothetical protein
LEILRPIVVRCGNDVIDVTEPILVAALAALSAELLLQPQLDHYHQVILQAEVNRFVLVMDHDT